VLCKICLFDCPATSMVKIEECGCSFCRDVRSSTLMQWTAMT
jgi:hypothetical protein